MRKRELFRLPVGRYELTDDIQNYYYTLVIALSKEDGKRLYWIYEKGSSSYHSIFMLEYEGKDEDYGYTYKYLSAMAGIPGLKLHSDDTYSLLRKLEFVPRGSFKEFVERTKIKS